MGRKQICEKYTTQFQDCWNQSLNTKEVANKMKMTVLEVKRMAYSLRRRNISLKHFKSRPHKFGNRKNDPTPNEIKERAERIRQNW